MKYERLTNRGEPFYGFEKCRTCEYGKDGCDNWCDQITGCFCRLQELEDKIESGELCDREEVRKETAREILSKIIDICKREEAFQNGNYNIQNVPLYLGIANGCAFIREQTIDLMSEYGVELFGNSDKLEDGE